jgi:hypothetical protein
VNIGSIEIDPIYSNCNRGSWWVVERSARDWIAALVLNGSIRGELVQLFVGLSRVNWSLRVAYIRLVYFTSHQ